LFVVRIAVSAGIIAGLTLAAQVDPGPEDTVILIHGLCPDSLAASAQTVACSISISRQQFEALMSVLAPNGQRVPVMKGQFAKAYAELLALENAARGLGLDKSPEYVETLRWLQTKTLADLLRRSLEKEAGAVTDADIARYYREKLPEFEEARIQRLVLPKTNFSVEDQHKFEQDAKRIAGGLRHKAAQGEDLQRLQREGYQALGFSGPPPATNVGAKRRRDLPSGVSNEVFSLSPGGITEVKEETYSFVIYKLETKRTLPLEEVQDEVTRDLALERLDQAIQSITTKIRTELKQNYFGTGLEN
jgi:hypothetical protein